MKHDDLKKRLVELIENKDAAASNELKEGLEEVFSLAETAEKQKDIIKKFQHAQDIVIPHQLDEMKKIIKTYKNALEHVNLELKEIERSSGTNMELFQPIKEIVTKALEGGSK